MQKEQKERLVAELTEALRTSETLIVADYRGLSVNELDRLRTALLEHGARFSVVKNTLTKIAAEAAGREPLLAMLEGPTAIAFLESEGDPVAVAKALAAAARETRILTIRGGLLEGSTITAEQIADLATLPPVDQLRGQVLGAITAPLYAVVGLFAAPLRDLVGLIDARIEQLGGESAAEAPVAEAAPAVEEPAAEARVEEPGAEAQVEEPKAEEVTETTPEEAAGAASSDQEGDA